MKPSGLGIVDAKGFNESYELDFLLGFERLFLSGILFFEN